jgi:hypothetical protein
MLAYELPIFLSPLLPARSCKYAVSFKSLRGAFGEMQPLRITEKGMTPSCEEGGGPRCQSEVNGAPAAAPRPH